MHCHSTSLRAVVAQSWFTLDILSVSVSGFDILSVVSSSSSDDDGEGGSELSRIKILRTLRVLRLIKVRRARAAARRDEHTSSFLGFRAN